MLSPSCDAALASGLTLALDTASDRPSLVLARGLEVLVSQSLAQRALAAELAPAVKQLCVSANTTVAAIDTIRVCVGPGSFTGIRLGLALVAGLRLAKPCTALGFSSMVMMASAHSVSDGAVALPSIQEEVFVQAFRDGMPEAALTVMPQHALATFANGRPIFTDTTVLNAAILLALPATAAISLQPVYGRTHYAA